MRRGKGVILAAAVLAVASPALAATATPTTSAGNAILARAHLGGFYALNGVITRAVNVPGERRGKPVTRFWAFVSSCPGACGRIVMVRQRGRYRDTVVLRRRRPGFYSGAGSFDAPVRCDGRLYRAGERAHFTITVRITGAIVTGNLVQATRFVATYNNPWRVALTRCVTLPSSDAARYVGTPPAVAATLRVLNSRSSTGS